VEVDVDEVVAVVVLVSVVVSVDECGVVIVVCVVEPDRHSQNSHGHPFLHFDFQNILK